MENKVAELEKEILALKNAINSIDGNMVQLIDYTKKNIQNINNLFIESRITKEVITALLNIANTKNLVTGKELEDEMVSIAETASRKDIENSIKSGNLVKVDEATEVSIVVFKNDNTNFAYEKTELLPNSIGKKVGEMVQVPVLDGKQIVQVDSEVLEIYDVVKT